MRLSEITSFCFAASYTLAWILELVQLLWPRRVQRLAALALVAAGLFAHSVFLVVQQPPLDSGFGSLLLLAWVLAVFSLIGTLHYGRLAWAVFVLPLIIGLVVLAGVFRPLGPDGKPLRPDTSWLAALDSLWGERFWVIAHGVLLLLAAVGVCVGFVASVMYLVQSRQLRDKVPPGRGLRLLSLERLEAMNRRAINWAFPLFTAGVLLGAVLLLQRFDQLQGWTDLKVLAAVALWLVFPVLLYLRYGYHLRGRSLAMLTIAAFALLVVTLAASHTLVPGAGP